MHMRASIRENTVCNVFAPVNGNKINHQVAGYSHNMFPWRPYQDVTEDV